MSRRKITMLTDALMGSAGPRPKCNPPGRRARGSRLGRLRTALRRNGSASQRSISGRCKCSIANPDWWGPHHSSYACHGNKRRKSQSGYRRHDRQRARVVRFRRLRLIRHDEWPLFFPGDDKTISLLKAFAVFGVGFVMRPVGSVLFGIYGDRFGRRLALSAVIFLMAFSTVAIGLLPTYAQAGVLAPILLVVFRLLQGLSAGGEWGGSTSYIVEYAPEGRREFIGSWQQVSVGSGFLFVP